MKKTKEITQRSLNGSSFEDIFKHLKRKDIITTKSDEPARHITTDHEHVSFSEINFMSHARYKKRNTEVLPKYLCVINKTSDSAYYSIGIEKED